MEQWSDDQVAHEALELARALYALMGYEAKEGFRFDLSRHPQERLCWDMACEAFSRLRDTDPNDCIDEYEAPKRARGEG